MMRNRNFASQGQALKELRQKQGISQSGLAAQTGIAQTTISDIELGVFAPSPANREKLAVVLGAEFNSIEWPENNYPLTLHNQRQPQRAPEGSAGDRLKAIRLTSGQSQAEIALQIGITEQKYARIERGYTKQPDKAIVEKLVEIFGPDVANLFS